MTWLAEHIQAFWIDIGIVLAFVAYAVGSGLRARKIAAEDLTQYFLAGRSLTGTQAGFSMAATQFAADTPLLVTGLVATSGIFALWRLWIYALAFLLLGFLLAPAWRRAGVLTDAELSEARYGGRAGLYLRATKAVYFGLVFNCAVLAMVLLAASRFAEQFLPWSSWFASDSLRALSGLLQWADLTLTQNPGPDAYRRSADTLVSLGAILALTGFYSTTGGLRSVVRTDVAQLGLALGGTALLTYVLLDAVGGRAGLLASLPAALAHHPAGMGLGQLLAFTPGEAQDVEYALLAVLALQWLLQMNADGTGYLAQRCMACRSDRDATRATLIFAWTQVFLRSLLWLPIALSLLVLYPIDPDNPSFTATREFTYVRAIAELLPVGARGVLLTAMFAALASTLDTHLNWGASYLANDLYGRVYCQAIRKREPSRSAQVTVARLSNLFLIAIAGVVMFNLGSLQGAWKLTLLLGAGMGVPLVLRWIWWRVTALSELASILASGVLAPLLLYLVPDSQEALRLLLMALGTTLTVVVTAMYVAPAQAEDSTLGAFYNHVRPPGFWSPVARAAGLPEQEGPQQLYRNLGKTAAAAFSLFCALVGVGTWLIAGTVPRWVPIPTMWAPALLVLALLASVYWWPKHDATAPADSKPRAQARSKPEQRP